MKKIVVISGATGNLGERIVKALLEKGASVYAIVRASTNAEKVKKLEELGVKVFRIDMSDSKEIAKACEGASCVISALSGLRDVIINTQRKLLDGAVMAGVPHFIPSDFSLDFTNLKVGQNRNLDLRREFYQYLEEAPIASTTKF
jgi:uncharacterized protein YbjT (DUF2867 family)